LVFAGVLVGVVDTKESPNNIFIVAQKPQMSTFNHYLGGLFLR